MEGQDIINIKLIKESDNNDININTNENNIVLDYLKKKIENDTLDWNEFLKKLDDIDFEQEKIEELIEHIIKTNNSNTEKMLKELIQREFFLKVNKNLLEGFLMQMTENNHLDAVRCYLDKQDLNKINQYEKDLFLFVSVNCKLLDISKKLLNAGANPWKEFILTNNEKTNTIVSLAQQGWSVNLSRSLIVGLVKESWEMRQLYFQCLNKDIKDENNEYVSILTKLDFLKQISKLGVIALNYTFSNHFAGGSRSGKLWGTHEIQTFNLARKKKEIYDSFLDSKKELKKSLLEILKSGNKELLSSDLFSQLIQNIWISYTRPQLLTFSFFFFLLLTCLFCMVYVTEKIPKLVFTGLVDLLSVIHIFIELHDLIRGGKTEIHIKKKKKVEVPEYFLDFWNYFDLACYTLLAIISSFYIYNVFHNNSTSYSGWETRLLALIILYLWTKILEYGIAFRITGHPLKLAIAMGYKLFKYLAIVLLVILAFSQSFHILLRNLEIPYSFPKIFLTLYLSFMGNFNYQDIENSDSALAIIFFILLTLIGYALLFNLLISTMSHAYESVEDDVDKELIILRAEAIYHHIRLYVSDKKWKEIVNNALFPPQTKLFLLTKLKNKDSNIEDWKKEPWKYGGITVNKYADILQYSDNWNQKIFHLQLSQKMEENFNHISEKLKDLDSLSNRIDMIEKKLNII